MHCYETRFGGKCATEVTLPPINQKFTHCEEIRDCHSQQPTCYEQPPGGTGHHLRSRSHFWPQAGLVATTAEEQTRDSNSQPQPARTTRDVEDSPTQQASNAPLRKKKRLTAEEKLIEDNKAYYKLEMKNNKLRSSGYFMTNRTSFEMGHAFAREAEASTVISPKSSSGYINCNGGNKNNNDIKTISHKISNDSAVKDSQGEDCEKSRLRSSRKSDSECCNAPESNVCEKSINNSESVGVDIDNQSTNNSSDTKNNNQHKSGSECKASSRRIADCGKESLSSNSLQHSESVEKNTSCIKQVCEESENQGDAKTESSGSGTIRTRIRLSELSLLSNEAENFMFGEPVKKISSDDSSDEECVPLKLKIVKKCHAEDQKTKWKTKQTVGRKKGKQAFKKVQRKVKISSGKPNKKIPRKGRKKALQGVQQYDESSVESTDINSLGSSSDANNLSRRHRKRRTHAEAFIHDNLDYYKFEIPGSRLRFQGSVLPQVVPIENRTPETENHCGKKLKENSHTCDSNKENSSNSSDSPLIQLSVKSLEAIRKGLNEKLTVETGSVPLHDPELMVEPGIKKEELNDKNNADNLLTKEITLDKLQFSFETTPQREPWYQTYRRQDTGNEIYLSCPIDTSYWKSFLLPYEMNSELTSAAGSSNLPSGSRSLDESVTLRKRKKRFAHLIDKKPRKSPRCHASTLAILSSLVHFRKRKEPDKAKEDFNAVKVDHKNNEEEDQERNKEDSSSLPVLGDFSTIEESPQMKKDFSDLVLNIDEMLESFPENESCMPQSPKISSDGSEPKLRTYRSSRGTSKKSSKLQKEKVSKKMLRATLKESDLIDVDYFMLANLIISKDNPHCISKKEPRNRGGPVMDVVSLLDSYSECCCANATIANKDCPRCGKDLLSPALRELSCNSSECGASSTCDTNYSDALIGRRGIRGKRRKRKKNRTGWPVDKQKFKKRFHLRLKKGNENAPLSKSDPVKHSAPVKMGELVDLSITGESSSVVMDTVGQTCTEKVENTEQLENVERIDEITAPVGGKVVSKEEEVNCVGISNEPNQSDRKIDNTSENVPVLCNLKPEKHSRLLRTGSLDSSTRSELKPCVRVKRIPNLSEYQIVPTIKIGISSRRLRSASSSSLSSTPVTKTDFSDESIKDESSVNRRSCRKKRPKFSDSWDGWWSPNHR